MDKSIPHEIFKLRRLIERLPGQLFPALSGGAVVSTAAHAGAVPGSDEVHYYGGYLVGEGMSPTAIEFMCRAHRALPQILDELERLQERFECFYRLAIESKQEGDK